MEQRAAPAPLPASAFHCLLDEQPTHLLPLRLAKGLDRELPKALIVNPTCVFTRNGGLPSRLCVSPESLENIAVQGNMVWVLDTETGIDHPFWYGKEFSSLLDGLGPGDPEPDDFPPHARAVLACAGVLVRPGGSQRRMEEWAHIVLHCRKQFERGFAPVGRLMHPFHIAALRRYYRYRLRNGLIRLGDNQSEQRYIAHNDSVARFFHELLTKAVTQMLGHAVKPSYVYLSSYLGGSELEKHNDRPQCEYSISFCLDYSPEPMCQTPWPLHLETKHERVTVYQAIGDGLLYRGRDLPHYRFPLRMGHTSTHLFFHYVDPEFQGPLA